MKGGASSESRDKRSVLLSLAPSRRFAIWENEGIAEAANAHAKVSLG
jgi:hypothetical protein